MTYILVIATNCNNRKGSFSTLIYGPSDVVFTRLSEYIYMRENKKNLELNNLFCLDLEMTLTDCI